MDPLDSTITPEIAHQVVEEMEKIKLPLSAMTYHVWFGHRVGWYPEMSIEIARAQLRENGVTETFCNNLYTKYIATDKRSDALREAQSSARQLIESVIGDVQGSSGTASEYRSELNQFVEQLGKAADVKAVREIVKGLILQTSNMANASDGLRKNLQQATNDIDRLREEMNQLEQENLTDSLTRLNNRKALVRHFKICFETFEARGEPFCVLMLDIDHFKSFNDTYGHDVGDAVLRSVSTTLSDTGHPATTPHRYGGEEFCVLVGGCKLNEAVEIGEDIRKQIEGRQLMIARTGQKINPITVSVGVAESAPSDTSDSLIQRADEALYLAKGSGRNNVKCERDVKSGSPSPR